VPDGQDDHKLCCLWWSGLFIAFRRWRKRLGSHADLSESAWLRACLRRKSKPRWAGRSSSAKTWYESTRRLWTQHLKRVAADPWSWRMDTLSATHRRRLSVKGHALPEEPLLPLRLCPECKRQVTCGPRSWQARLIKQHYHRVYNARRDEWVVKVNSIVTGIRHRPPRMVVRQKAKLLRSWRQALERAITVQSYRNRWRCSGEWERWSVNLASNLAKRGRWRVHRQGQTLRQGERKEVAGVA
jgi:hypothetical protein